MFTGLTRHDISSNISSSAAGYMPWKQSGIIAQDSQDLGNAVSYVVFKSSKYYRDIENEDSVLWRFVGPAIMLSSGLYGRYIALDKDGGRAWYSSARDVVVYTAMDSPKVGTWCFRDSLCQNAHSQVTMLAPRDGFAIFTSPKPSAGSTVYSDTAGHSTYLSTLEAVATAPEATEFGSYDEALTMWNRTLGPASWLTPKALITDSIDLGTVARISATIPSLGYTKVFSRCPSADENNAFAWRHIMYISGEYRTYTVYTNTNSPKANVTKCYDDSSLTTREQTISAYGSSTITSKVKNYSAYFWSRQTGKLHLSMSGEYSFALTLGAGSFAIRIGDYTAYADYTMSNTLINSPIITGLFPNGQHTIDIFFRMLNKDVTYTGGFNLLMKTPVSTDYSEIDMSCITTG